MNKLGAQACVKCKGTFPHCRATMKPKRLWAGELCLAPKQVRKHYEELESQPHPRHPIIEQVVGEDNDIDEDWEMGYCDTVPKMKWVVGGKQHAVWVWLEGLQHNLAALLVWVWPEGLQHNHAALLEDGLWPWSCPIGDGLFSCMACFG